jgi:hypothetical protein
MEHHFVADNHIDDESAHDLALELSENLSNKVSDQYGYEGY